MKKIIAITGSRSEYDLMSSLYVAMHKDPEIDFSIIVTGAHLSPTYGYSVKQIEADGLRILQKIESLLDADSRSARIKSASISLQSAINIISDAAPDLLLCAGDREEVIITSLIGGYLGIPTLHFYGGDHVQDSHIDNPIRHATSKLSTAHFVTLEQHKHRLIAMGEPENRIHVVGNLALDRFVHFSPHSKSDIHKHFEIKYNFNNFALMIFHPIVEEEKKAGVYFEYILKSLIEMKIDTFIGYPNSDPGNRSIIEIIEKYQNNRHFIFYKNLPRDWFLSIYKNSDFIIGNSSSGIIEAASVPMPAINVGHRQTSRASSGHVIYCAPNPEDIQKAIVKACSPTFRAHVATIKNIYGDGNCTKKALDKIKCTNFMEMLYKNEDPLI